MASSDEFLELLRDLLNGLGPIRIRRMFGGAGIYCDGMMFALVSDDTLYLKADDVNRGNFEARSLAPFRYETKDGRMAVMSYWRAPEELLDDPDELMVWARAALEAARRAQLNKAKRMRSG
ncbi:MAG TPA: TfoX/Sxy family protein [Hyphomicrobiaceae bacterium]|nr:TfoX/Sxy family protein [Hyphomicrobiaceae bacterium]